MEGAFRQIADKPCQPEFDYELFRPSVPYVTLGGRIE
jgi:hypothetical protein